MMNTLALRWQLLEPGAAGEPLQLVPGLWVDGEPLADPGSFAIDLAAWQRSLRAPGDYFLVTCWCGVAGCAGVRTPVVVRHGPEGIRWRVAEPVAWGELCFEPAACAEALAQGVCEGLAWLSQASVQEPLALVPAGNLRFLRRQAAPPRPVAGLSDFRRIVWQVARQAGAWADEVRAPAVTPNFHAARLRWRGGEALYLLCSQDGHWACARAVEPGCRLAFVDPPEALEAALMQAGDALPWRVEELAADFVRQPGMSEADVRYWKPRTLGEGLFNWWD